MTELYLDNKPWSYIRFGLGVISLIAALSFLIAYHRDLQLVDYFIISIFSLTGLIHMTNDFGTQKSYLRLKDNSLIIKWLNKFKPLSVKYSEIESIYLRKTEITINQKVNKSVKLKLMTFRTDQKKEIYNFFIKLSDDHKLTLIRQFN